MPNPVIPNSGNIPDLSGTPGKAELDILNSVDDEQGNEEGKDDEPISEFGKEGEEGNEQDGDDGEGDDKEKEGEEGQEGEEGSDEESNDESNDDEELGDDELDDISLYQKLKKDNPEIFKSPAGKELRDVIFREQKYSEMFPTVEDAQSAKDMAEKANMLETELMEGSATGLLEAVAETDKTAFANLANNILPAIAKLNPDVYGQILQLPIKRAIQRAYIDAKRAGNKNLMNAALYVDQFYFGDAGIGEDPKGVKKEPAEKSPELTRVEREKAEIEERLQNDFVNSVTEIIQHKLGKEITSSIEKYDFDAYKRRNVARDIDIEINNLLASDKRYQAGIRSLYNQAKSARFTGDWKARITNAYLARAKAVLPLAKRKVIEEATGKKIERKLIAKRLVPSNSSGKVPTKLEVSKIDKSKTSDLDILNDKVTLKS